MAKIKINRNKNKKRGNRRNVGCDWCALVQKGVFGVPVVKGGTLRLCDKHREIYLKIVLLALEKRNEIIVSEDYEKQFNKLVTDAFEVRKTGDVPWIQ